MKILVCIMTVFLMGCQLGRVQYEQKDAGSEQPRETVPAPPAAPVRVRPFSFTGGVALGWTVPVVLGREIDTEHINGEILEEGSGHETLAKVELIIHNMPDEENGKEFTVMGGGPSNTGLHGPESSAFIGPGLHFARTPQAKKDFTRTAADKSLRFVFYYTPTNIYSWGERYFYGTELALTIMRRASAVRILHAGNNQFNWAIAGVGPGRSARIIITLPD